MPFEIKMGSDGILRIELSGDLDQTILETFRRELTPYVEASTPSKPLKNIVYFKQIGALAPAIRHYLIDLNRDQRLGQTAYIHPPAKARVLGRFILNATGRDHIEYFEQEQEAVKWLHNHKN